MRGTSHRTAVVFVPPEELWGPIQEVRRRFDRQVRRWMPHVTLLYPFAPPDRLEETRRPLAAAARAVAPFGVAFARLRFFEHGRGRRTYWLEPDPPAPFRTLHAELLRRLPQFDDTARFPHGFTPHLSVGQARGPEEAEHLERFVAERFAPVAAEVGEIALIERGPDTPFEIRARFALGGVPGQGRSKTRT